MWCGVCQQDVPGIARPGNRRAIVCPRCAQQLLTVADEPTRPERAGRGARRAAQNQPQRADSPHDDAYRPYATRSDRGTAKPASEDLQQGSEPAQSADPAPPEQNTRVFERFTLRDLASPPADAEDQALLGQEDQAVAAQHGADPTSERSPEDRTHDDHERLDSQYDLSTEFDLQALLDEQARLELEAGRKSESPRTSDKSSASTDGLLSDDEPIFEADDNLPGFDEIWEEQAWRQANQSADRLLAAIEQTRQERPAARPRRRIDSAQSQAGPHQPPQAPTENNENEASGFFVARVALIFGGLALAGGAVAMAWGESEALAAWRVAGIVAGAIGQLAVVTGLGGILMSLWQANRATRRSLEELDSQVQNLRLYKPASGEPQDEAARSFYDHYVGGANARTLMADLQGQIELLAKRIRDDERAA